MSSDKIKIAITQGDINGIGYEIIFKALADPRILEICTPVIYGSSKVAAYHRKALNLPAISLNNIRSADEAHPKRINMVNCLDDNVRVELGKPTEISGNAAFLALEKAVEDLKKGSADALVTAPINKKVIQSNQFDFPGHTEYLASSFSGKPLMLMVSDLLRVGVVTGHIPLSQICSALSSELIIEKLRILNQSLKKDFMIRKPRIAVLGLNPHAGDNGLLGKEEDEIIKPALEKAKEEGIMAFGPYPADGLFATENTRKFDAILAMYHDQGLAPFKALSFSTGVNYTAGLPIVRTSPDHGTAYEITGQNQADEQSFLSAIYTAIDVFNYRKNFDELSANPLKTTDVNSLGADE
ncbi:4-hydroxythreonine-4-phosphate dehydrogenase PdxA [Alkalitalea saponilacus]|uniref:4-hydroxythreonine-4-phosphate dehydrogenase n=1 Tax=Alkalitalea saponilacus TaxID=889453 RepID=A0A1T5FWE6_9BACT|nr:4-hydroxythreonine-4-phosphate dehydrogenase PdxA [Alkalitalea saponilacus]ASB49509.1 4-hydroxythreonine-4-phosphate dehydrogenase PdxA [Alkalitalea saponilacus]SKC00384.1 4-hydroxythreonine-4-phosphate dehydrogenase [Alkalitalea saponilacus]